MRKNKPLDESRKTGQTSGTKMAFYSIKIVDVFFDNYAHKKRLMFSLQCFCHFLEMFPLRLETYSHLQISPDLEIEYGDVTNIYNCDTFNENEPPTSDPTYISTLGSDVYEVMSKVNKDAVWLMQGWLFYSDSSFWKPPQMKALLHSVPFGKMIVLDLFVDVKPVWESSSQFYGTPYVWCMLHKFGGNIEMYGILDTLASGPIVACVSENSTMVGVGMCMEGIEHNLIVYELMPEMAFRKDKVHVEVINV
ncbi:putative alpha-N-acetylglucosaminidase [Helianthus anomalus]